MSNAGIEPHRLLAALKLTRNALVNLESVQHLWLRSADDRPARAAVAPLVDDLRSTLAVLCNSHGDHWKAADDLRSIAQRLLALGYIECVEPLSDVQLAYEELVSNRGTV
jgi:hypothetical protein